LWDSTHTYKFSLSYASGVGNNSYNWPNSPGSNKLLGLNVYGTDLEWKTISSKTVLSCSSQAAFAADRYFAPGSTLDALSELIYWVAPANGYIATGSEQRAAVTVAPGGASEWRIYVVVNGSYDTAKYISIAGASTSGYATGGTVSVSVGDTVSIFWEEYVGGASSTRGTWSGVFYF
jgi:hypothetical protein